MSDQETAEIGNQGRRHPMSDLKDAGMSDREPITDQVRAETVAKLIKAREVFAAELDLVACLDGHRIIQNDNLGYYRSGLHCSCAAEWWAGEHSGDPSYEDMWNIHRAEVVAAFLADRNVEGGTP